MIVLYFKTFLHNLKQLILWSMKNKLDHTKILSTEASLHAKYDTMVSVGKNTVISANVSIGYGSYVNVNSWIENTIIGNYCSISDHVNICPAEHDISRPLSSPLLGDGIRTKQVRIGNDVLISHNVTILSGTTIGNGAVVAAGAVVTKNTHIGEYEIWGGVPARFIKKRFDDETISKIKKLNLYQKNIDQIKKELLDKYEN
jgi:acetyltransferase-like isoleucine patch superfamily enzyme